MPEDRQLTEAEIEAKVDKDIAEAENARAEARAFAADERKADAEARKLNAEAIVAEVTANKTERVEREEMALDKHHHVYVFDKDVTEGSVKECMRQLAQWERLATEPLHVQLVINSPGGGIFDGFALVNYIQGMQERGSVVDTLALGMAASMGGVLLQVGNTRAMGKNAMLLIHEAQFHAVGSWGDVMDTVDMVKMLQSQILDLFVSRALPVNPRTNKAFIEKNWRRKDWWITAPLAAKFGFCDEVR